MLRSENGRREGDDRIIANGGWQDDELTEASPQGIPWRLAVAASQRKNKGG